MIVLDEQLVGYGLRPKLEAWYRGSLTDIKKLRPGTSIQDEAIPELLRTVRQPTFITINVSDFWRKTKADPKFAVVCFALTHDRADEIIPLLRRLFATEAFRTRKRRMGKIARVTPQQVLYYTTKSWAVRKLKW